MNTSLIRYAGAALLLALLTTLPAVAGAPTEQIKETTDKILDIVQDPKLKGADQAKERATLIRAAADERFDWDSMARRALGRHWRARTAEEKKEFTSLFSQLIGQAYLAKIAGYSGEEVRYDSEKVRQDHRCHRQGHRNPHPVPR